MLVQYAMQRSSELPDVPALVELGKNDEDRQVLAFYVSGAENGRSIITTPGVPAERLTALRRAFDQMLKDKEFLADIEKSGSDLIPATGEEIEKIIAQAANAPKAVIERTRAAIAGK